MSARDQRPPSVAGGALPHLSRRQWGLSLLGALGALNSWTPRGVRAEPGGIALFSQDFAVPTEAGRPRLARLIVAGERPPTRLLILLHGRGETGSDSLALRAWPELYGLLDAEQRLRRSPVVPVLERPRIATERLARLNASLAARPYEGFAIVCPVTPDPSAWRSREAGFDAYLSWLLHGLVPAVRSRLPGLGTRVGLDGCSMGGYIALEMLVRAPRAFSSFGAVQAAIGEWRVPGYVERLARALDGQTAPPIHVQTSTADPFRVAAESLSAALTRSAVNNDLDVIEGPHDQAWLRQIGTLEMLLWHDRNL